MGESDRLIPECPRCGYDQSGEVARWADACPLAGTCPECGLAMRWVDVFNGRYRFPRWSSEHARGWPASARAFVQTVARCFTPWRLWRDLKMHHRVAWVRLAIIGVVGAVCVAVLSLLLLGVMDAIRMLKYGNWNAAIDNIFEPFADPTDALPPLRDHVGAVGSRITDRWMIVTAWTLVVAPLGVVALRQTMRSARVRAGNLLRIWIYGLVVVPVVLTGWELAASLLSTVYLLLHGNVGSVPLTWLLEQIGELFEWFALNGEWRSVAFVAVAYLVLWLGLAYRRYLELAHAWWVALASVAVAMLVGVGLISLLPCGLQGLM